MTRHRALGRLRARRGGAAGARERSRPLTARDAIRAFYELYAEQQGKPRWGDKTPRYMRAMPRIRGRCRRRASST